MTGMADDVRVPREAIEAGARALYEHYSTHPATVSWEHESAMRRDEHRGYAKTAVVAALPFLRAQWEAELLSDEAIERAIDFFEDPVGHGPGDEEYFRGVIRAALGSPFVPVERD